MSLPPWLRAGEGGVVLSLHVQPGARKTEVAGRYGEALKVRLAAPPVDGKANEALIAFLAATLDLPRKSVTLLSGASARTKRLRVSGVEAAGVVARLDPDGRA
ncbi:MAG: DUF167 domain-containing protein [Rhodocyclaceae bacterium]|nr:DUF167 domain-containing protein [Rhodocyclaceae bacterium]